MCDIRAFGKEIMDVPDETDIHKAAEESEVDSEHQIETRSQQSTTTFNTPVFESDLDINLDSFNADEFLSGFTDDDDDDESVKKKTGYEYDSDFEPEVLEASKKLKNKPQVKWNCKRFKRVYTVERFIDFTKGQTRVNKKLQIVDETICGIIEKVLSEKKTSQRW